MNCPSEGHQGAEGPVQYLGAARRLISWSARGRVRLAGLFAVLAWGMAHAVAPVAPAAPVAPPGSDPHAGHARAAPAQTDAHDHGGAPAKGLRAQRFDERLWPQLLAKGPRPAAYLFTTTTCATCPAAFEALHQAVHQSMRAGKLRKSPALAAVVMDADGPQALRHARHFAGMSALYVFDGFEPAIRQAVDPAWPNVTPYVVLIDRQGQVQRLLGQPDAASMQRWLN